MSDPSIPKPGYVFFALLSSDKGLIEEVTRILSETYGLCPALFTPYIFDHSQYYCEEMGAGLTKQLLLFTQFYEKEKIPSLKRHAWKLEKKFTNQNGNRVINIDPGYLTAENFILLTYKNFTHRIYIGESVYADLTLIYRSRISTYAPLPWTYADYCNPEVGGWLASNRLALL